MDTNIIQKAEAKLRQLESEINKSLPSVSATPDMGSDIDSYDTETDEAEELGNALGVKDTFKKRLLAVTKALDKIKNGTYGVCENCGQEIPPEIIEVAPESEFCKNCKSTSV